MLQGNTNIILITQNYGILSKNNLNREKPTGEYNETLSQGIIHYSRFDLESIGDLYGNNFRRDRLNNYTIANLEVILHVSKNFDIYGEVQNLFDKSYSIIYDYPLPGRIFFTGLSLGLNNRP